MGCKSWVGELQRLRERVRVVQMRGGEERHMIDMGAMAKMQKSDMGNRVRGTCTADRIFHLDTHSKHS